MSNTPESIVTSLDWSKKLKEAWWPRAAAIFFWHESGSRLEAGEGTPYSCHLVEQAVRSEDSTCLRDFQSDTEYRRYFAAPTAEEILRRLPYRLQEWRLSIFAQVDGSWTVVYVLADGLHPDIPLVQEKTLANAAAAMYCYLAEQKLLPTSSNA